MTKHDYNCGNRIVNDKHDDYNYSSGCHRTVWSSADTFKRVSP